MAKGKSFADKVMKGRKPKDELEVFKVIRARKTPKGTVRYETHVVKVEKGEDEAKAFGL